MNNKKETQTTYDETYYEKGILMARKKDLIGTQDGLIPIKYKNLHLILNVNFCAEKNEEDMKDFALVSMCRVEENKTHLLELAKSLDRIPPKTIPLRFFTFNGNDGKMGAIVVTKGKMRKHIKKPQIIPDINEGVSFKANIVKKIVIPAFFDNLTFIKYLSIVTIGDEEIPEFLVKVELNGKEGLWLTSSRKFLVPPIFDINSIDLTMLTDDNINSQIIFGKINGFSHVYEKGSLKRIINVSLKLPEDTKEVLQEFIQKTRVRKKR